MTNSDRPSNRHNDTGWKQFAVWLHLVWLIIFSFIIFAGPYAEAPLGNPAPAWLTSLLSFGPILELSEIGTSARQLNSLDLIGLALTLLGILLAIFALGSFTLVRGAAMDAAADEAKNATLKWLNENRASLVDQKVIAEILETDRIMSTLANEVERRISEKDDDDFGDDLANEFADAMDREGSDND